MGPGIIVKARAAAVALVALAVILGSAVPAPAADPGAASVDLEPCDQPTTTAVNPGVVCADGPNASGSGAFQIRVGKHSSSSSFVNLYQTLTSGASGGAAFGWCLVMERRSDDQRRAAHHLAGASYSAVNPEDLSTHRPSHWYKTDDTAGCVSGSNDPGAPPTQQPDPTPTCSGVDCFRYWVARVVDPCAGPIYPSIMMGVGKVESSYGVNNGPSSAGAEGPYQFLPSTWAEWKRDGNGDGVMNVYHVPDAMAGAHAYLNYLYRSNDENLSRALLAYNGASSPNGYDEKVYTEARVQAPVVDATCADGGFEGRGDGDPDDGAGGPEDCGSAWSPSGWWCRIKWLFIPRSEFFADVGANMTDELSTKWPTAPAMWALEGAGAVVGGFQDGRDGSGEFLAADEDPHDGVYHCGEGRTSGPSIPLPFPDEIGPKPRLEPLSACGDSAFLYPWRHWIKGTMTASVLVAFVLMVFRRFQQLFGGGGGT